MFRVSSVLLPCAFLLPIVSMAQGQPSGQELYFQYCSACHGQEGRGIPNVFPPLAGSDFLENNREKALRAPLEGLKEKIVVCSQTYDGWMPPVTLRDEQLAALFNTIFSSWGNAIKPTNVEEIAALRAKTKYPTFEKLLAAMSPETLPAAPEGWQFNVGATLDFQPIRLATHPNQRDVLILAANGDVWKWEIASREITILFAGKDYLNPALGETTSLGLNTDNKDRLYIVSNQCNKTKNPVANEVTIWRTQPWTQAEAWTQPKPWLTTSIHFGVGPYNHGVNHIAQGPDGLLYVNSGARTDGGEQGQSPNYDKSGETPLTATMWRLNPEAEHPNIEIFCNGLRNTFHFIWDKDNHLLGVENGPDADAAEELNLLEYAKHYGFPYHFSDWTSKAYPYTPNAPKDIPFTRPFRNLGPDAGAPSGMSTFTPHSCPAAIVELDKDWPAPLGDSFLVARYGNYLKEQSGFDLLQIKPNFAAQTITTKIIAAPLARPISMIKLPGHRLLIAEYCRGNSLAAGTSTPGRLIILEPK